MKIKKFEDIEARKKARELVKDVYEIICMLRITDLETTFREQQFP